MPATIQALARDRLVMVLALLCMASAERFQPLAAGIGYSGHENELSELWAGESR
jgi:hypothetical protein